MAHEPENEDDFSDFDLSEENDNLQEGVEDDLEEEDDLLFDIDDDLSTGESKKDNAGLTEELSEQLNKSQPPLSSSSTEPKGMLSPEEIPVTIVVEIGQVNMTMDQLLKLEPGNLLDINLNPENGVDLTINGKIVGKGELFRIGDVIGVRILQLGSK